MSHLVRAKVKLQAKNKKALVAALVAMGFKTDNICISETPSLRIRDYYGKQTNTKVNICVAARRGRSDIGFKFNTDGSVTLHGDSMYVNQRWQDQFTQQYSKAVIREVAAQNNFSVTEEQLTKQGEIHLTIESNW